MSYEYSLINTKAYITVPANRIIIRSLFCAISKFGVITHGCRKDSYNGDFFLIFINTHLVPYFIDHPNSVLIMLIRFHKMAEVQQALLNNSITCKYIVPYSSELNPIEEFFSVLKSKNENRMSCLNH